MSEQKSLGMINHINSVRKTDFLYRISIKALVRNAKGEVLVVKESGREWWDLPGGGMDHGEGIKSALARELKEEVNFEGDFKYTIIDVEEPAYLQAHEFWQLRLIFEVIPTEVSFSIGVDGDELAFRLPKDFEKSKNKTERKIYEYSNKGLLVKNKSS